LPRLDSLSCEAGGDCEDKEECAHGKVGTRE
jgi:hypothetical protein